MFVCTQRTVLKTCPESYEIQCIRFMNISISCINGLLFPPYMESEQCKAWKEISYALHFQRLSHSLQNILYGPLLNNIKGYGHLQ